MFVRANFIRHLWDAYKEVVGEWNVVERHDLVKNPPLVVGKGGLLLCARGLSSEDRDVTVEFVGETSFEDVFVLERLPRSCCKV